MCDTFKSILLTIQMTKNAHINKQIFYLNKYQFLILQGKKKKRAFAT